MNYDFALEVKYGGSDRLWYFYTDDIEEACVALSSQTVSWYELWDLADDEWAVWIGEDGESFHDHYAKHQLDDMIDGVAFDDDTMYVGDNGIWEYGL